MIFNVLRYGLCSLETPSRWNVTIYKKNEKWGANSKGAPTLLSILLFYDSMKMCFLTKQ